MKGFGNLIKKKPEEPTKLVVPKEILEEQQKFAQTEERELCMLVKEKLSFLSGNTEKSIEDLSKRLCVKDDLQKAYLNKNFKAVKEYFQKPVVTKRPVFSSVLSSKMESVQSVNEVPLEEDPVDDWEDFEVTEDDSKTNQKIKIKLIIVEISHTKKEQNIRKFLSPLASLTGQSPQFGMFHSALIVGPWYLEWSNKSLCIPKKIYSQSALLALDIKSPLETANVDDIIDKISECVCRWNAFHNYDRNKNNCQVFIEDLLMCLGINPDQYYKGQLGDSLKRMKQFGHADIKFKVDKELRELCQIKESEKEFKTHKELDEFVKKLDEGCVKKYKDTFEKAFPEDAALLKSLDRAFWLRNYREKDKPEWQPLEHQDGRCDCPFTDPIATKSFASQDWF